MVLSLSATNDGREGLGVARTSEINTKNCFLKATESWRIVITHIAFWFHLWDRRTLEREQIAELGDRFKSQFCYSVAAWPWADPFCSLASVSLSDNKVTGLGKFWHCEFLVLETRIVTRLWMLCDEWIFSMRSREFMAGSWVSDQSDKLHSQAVFPSRLS